MEGSGVSMLLKMYSRVPELVSLGNTYLEN